MSITKIRRRDGEIASFDRSRIESAILLASRSANETDVTYIPVVTDFIIRDLEHIFDDIFVNRIPSVEDVQDIVERNLMKFQKFEVAKTYIIYRAQRQEDREEKHEELVEQFENNTLQVTKSDGTKEIFDPRKIKKVFDRAALGYESLCPFRDLMEAFKKNLVDEIGTKDINRLLVKTCIDLVTVENIAWQEVAARLFMGNLYKQATKNRGITQDQVYSPQSYLDLFTSYVDAGFYSKDFFQYYSQEDILEAGRHLNKDRDATYSYTTVLSLSKRYLLNPNKVVKELPQEMYMSVGLFLAIPESQENRLAFALKIYEQCSSQKISLPTPTLLNSRTNWHQLSSCFKINIDDDLRAIYHGIENMAQISKFGGGIGVYLGNIRSRGGSIRGIHGCAGGVNPWIKVINDTAIAVNQLGARMGSISVTLDVWHRDIYDFLDLQTETGDIRSKAYDVFPAISIPDIFMKRVELGEDWTLFDPEEVLRITGKSLQDTYGEEFDAFYLQLEQDSRLSLKTTTSAKELFKKFLKTTVETGMPYVFYRDTVNRLNPNKHAGMVYSTQLCTEICQNTSKTKFIEETLEDGKIRITYEPGDLVTCNLASINVAKVYDASTIPETISVVMRILDNVITLNYYPLEESRRTALRYRPVGLGFLGLAEFLATHGYSYDSQEARDRVDEMFEDFNHAVYSSSIQLAQERGAYPLYEGSQYSQGILLGRDKEWYLTKSRRKQDWESVFEGLEKYGVRFGYHTAPAPNTSTAGVVGTTAALLPIYKKFFIETNLSASTIRVAPKLSSENFWLYKEYVNMDMNDVIDMISVVYKWVDQSISFEWMVDPSKVSPVQLYGYYMKAWKQGIKTVYYVRSLSQEASKEGCVSCSG